MLVRRLMILDLLPCFRQALTQDRLPARLLKERCSSLPLCADNLYAICTCRTLRTIRWLMEYSCLQVIKGGPLQTSGLEAQASATGTTSISTSHADKEHSIVHLVQTCPRRKAECKTRPHDGIITCSGPFGFRLDNQKAS